MKRTINLLTILLLLQYMQPIQAQVAKQGFWNSQMQYIAKEKSKTGWIFLRDEINPVPDQVFNIYPDAFNLGADDEMRITKVNKDKFGYEHFRYQQYYKGVRIIGAENIVHHNGNRTYMINGKFAFIRNMSVAPSISEADAFANAIASVNATSYLWENEAAIKNLREMNHDPDLSFEPKGEKVICMRKWNNDFDESNLALAYCFDLNVLPLTESKKIFVDAHSGEIIEAIPLTYSCSPGSGLTTWHGTKNFSTSDDEDFYLDYDCGDRPVISSRTGNPAIPWEYFDTNNNWVSGWDEDDNVNYTVGVSTYYYLFKVYDYFDDVQGRYSWDDDGADVNAFSENGGDEWTNYEPNNALWHGGSNVMFFGKGSDLIGNANNSNDFNALDVVAHEFTHGVTQTSAGLFYNSESGALNESFSDIFGEVVEYWFEDPVDGPTWLLGDDISGWGGFRNMSNPSNGGGGDPDTYEGSNWYDLDGCAPVGWNDFCGVHTNSGVQNFWFFLLAEGGSGVNDNGDAFSVEGIGIEKAADIAYRSLTEYLGATSGFSDAREGSLQAAADLFGSCSDEMIAVAKAWYAVGVGDDDIGDHVVTCSDYSGTSVLAAIHDLTAISIASCEPVVNCVLGSVTFTAGDYVVLRENFHAVPGSFFFAALADPCSYTYYKEEEYDQPDETEIESADKYMEPEIKIYPVPADQSVSVEFNLDEERQTTVTILDLSGRTISVLKEDEWLPAGKQHINFNTSKLAAGVYMCTVEAGNHIMKEKLIVQH